MSDRGDDALSVERKAKLLTRRNMIVGAGGLAAALSAGRLIGSNSPETFRPVLRAGDALNHRIQRLGLQGTPMAREFGPDQISAFHPSTGGFGALFIDPDPGFFRAASQGFPDWRLSVSGMVANPMRLTIADIRAMPAKSQITLHMCDEGWSAIGKWTGIPLGWLLRRAGLKPDARYIVFHCMDKIVGRNVYGSIDMFDAFHPQTILAHTMNDRPLPPNHGAPLRLRTELQIGYKNLKHIDGIVAIDDLARLGKAAEHGGMFEEDGYQWFGGF